MGSNREGDDPYLLELREAHRALIKRCMYHLSPDTQVDILEGFAMGEQKTKQENDRLRARCLRLTESMEGE